MAEIDRIIIRFEVHGGKEAQALLASMQKTLAGIAAPTAKAKQGMQGFAQSVGVGSQSMIVFGDVTDTAVLKISEFAVVIFALIGAYNALVRPIIDVEKNMKTVEAVSHATTRELKALQKEAVRLGTIFPGGAAKATEALVAIGQAGYDTRQSIELLEPVFKLATVGEIEFARTVELMITSINAFNKSTSDAAQMADTLAASISHTLTTVETFEMALPRVATLAGDLGISFEEVVALMGYLSDRGLKATRIGTALQNMFAQLSKEMKGGSQFLERTGMKAEQFDIKARGLADVLRDLSKISMDAGDKIDLLGLRGMYAGSTIENVDKILIDMVDSLEEAGEATYQASTMLESVTAKAGQFAGIIQEGLIAYFEPLLGLFHNILDALKDFFTMLANTSPVFKKFWRWFVVIATAVVGLSLQVKLLRILFVDFIWGKAILGSYAAIKKFVSGLSTIRIALASLRYGAITTTQAMTMMWGSLAGPVGLIASTVGVWALINHEMNVYRGSLRGTIDAKRDMIDNLKLEQEQLAGLEKRLTKSANEYIKLKEKGKDATEPLAEFYDVIVDIVDKYPEMSTFLLGIASDFGDLEFAIKGVASVAADMRDRFREAIHELEELSRKEFIWDLGKLTDEMTDEMSDWLKSDEFLAWVGVGLLEKVMNVLGLSIQTPSAPPLPKPKIDPIKLFVQQKLEKRYIETFGHEGAVFTLDKPMSDLRLFIELMKLSADEVDELGDYLLGLGVDFDKVLKIQSMITRQQVIMMSRDLKKDEDEDIDGDRDEDEKALQLADYRTRLSKMQAEFALDELKLRQHLINEHEDELKIKELLARRQQIHNNILQEAVEQYLVIYQAQLQITEDEKDREKIQKAINNLEMQQITLKQKEVELNIDLLETQDKIADRIYKRMFDAIERSLNKLKSLQDRFVTISDIMERLQHIRTVGELLGLTEIEIAQQQMQVLDSETDNITKTVTDLRKETGLWGIILDKTIIPHLLRIRAILTGKYHELKKLTDVEPDVDEKTIADFEKDAEDSLKQGLSSALQSDDLKNAIDVFADAIKKAVADRLADILVERYFEQFAQKLGRYEATTAGVGAAATGAGAGAGGASWLPWVGVGLMAFDMIKGMFEGDKIDELNRNLEYILRGAGYQLPGTFVLPEPGEFSWRRRGRDSLMLRFPQRGLDVNITHKFKWDPSKLAQAVASDMSVGGMKSSRQFSYMGD